MTVKINFTNARASKLLSALKLVHELAEGNMLDKHEIGLNDVTLQHEYDRQLKSLHEVDLFIEDLSRLC